MSTETRKPLGLFVLAVAATLIGLGLRNLPARLFSVAGDGVHDAVLNSADFSDADFARFTASRRHAVAWHAFATDEDDLAEAYTARAARDGTDDKAAADYYRQALAVQRAGLALEPSNPYGWAQMAFLTIQTGDDFAAAMDQLRLSMIAAPYEPKLMLGRLDMMIALHDFLNDDERASIGDLARGAWAYDAFQTATIANRHHYLDIIRDSVADNPDEAQKFADMMRDERMSVTDPPDNAGDTTAGTPDGAPQNQ